MQKGDLIKVTNTLGFQVNDNLVGSKLYDHLDGMGMQEET